MTSASQKVTRIADVDALRGFALLGILQVNIMAFASVFYGLPTGEPEQSFGFNDLVHLFISTIFEMKFYLLFSFLFGYSVTLQMQSAVRAGEPFIPRFLRRQAGLWVIGLLHAVLLFHGDILSTYAILGVVLLLWRNSADRTLIKSAVWLFSITAILWASLGVLQWMVGEMQDPAQDLLNAQYAYTAYTGSFSSVIMQHLNELKLMWLILLLIQAPCALAMFLLGFLAGKHQFLAQPDQYRPYLEPAVKAGLFIGLPASLITALTALLSTGTYWEIFGLALSLVTAPFLTFGIIALMLKFFGTERGLFWRDALAPAGRMALSNYLLQSLICGFIFYGYGLALIDQTTAIGNVLIGVLIFAFQLCFSHWWMKHYYYGPLEWLLRALTIGRWPDLKRKA
ncbi:DUF418 domain-containing protein [Pseudochrobactrum asaccharolyticum]|uniref:DUF418 domain-containing protein n=1 Tax=Pseudochrobactrum asaccharolyticum TaxID=354351 RepID=A0A366E8W0_9HYPH|nr:DUF418 domain-containing protein [Pseudochrobactrum asaccharolyticum]RBO98813.1 uncharacterized protein DFR47_101414 [Pseudochrobactrum asaccharolyticum]